MCSVRVQACVQCVRAREKGMQGKGMVGVGEAGAKKENGLRD